MSTDLDTTLTTVIGDEVPGVTVDGKRLPAAAIVAFGPAGDGTDGKVTSDDDPLPVSGTFNIHATDFNALVAAITAVREAVETIPGADVTEAEAWRIVGDTDQPDFENDWSEGPFPTRFYQDVDRVWVEVFMAVGDFGVPAFVLPEGYRPDTIAFDYAVRSISSDFSAVGTANVTLNATGEMIVVEATEPGFVVGSISFRWSTGT